MSDAEQSGITITGMKLSAEETAAVTVVLETVVAAELSGSPHHDAEHFEHAERTRAQGRRRRMSTWAQSELHTWRSAAGLT